MGLDKDKLCVVSPDVGRAKAAKKFSTMLDCDIAIMHKDRPKHNQAEITALIGNVHGKVCILNDDMIDTAGTICMAADMLMEKGAKSVRAAITHPILSGQAYEKINASALQEVIVTDTIPLNPEKDLSKFKVMTVADIFANVIERVHNYKEISSIFFK
jgi:ribose-phosphate pyrophosphokinase